MGVFIAKPGIASFIICFIFFFFILYVGFPIFNSGDDVYLLYLLGGGFGGKPTHLLHYPFALYPVIGWVIKTLLREIPRFNWYSITLYWFHFVSCWIVFRMWLTKYKFYVAAAIFSVVFFVFETPFLLNLTFTNTALITGMAGILLLIWETDRKPVKIKTIAIALSLIVISSMVRLHTLIPLLAMVLPVIIYRLTKKQYQLTYMLCAAILVIFIFQFTQSQYYKHEINEWETEEAYRQAVFSYFNRPKLKNPAELATEINFITNGLFWDKAFLSIEKLRSIRQSTNFSLLTGIHNRNYLYWLVVNNRIFLFASLFISVLLFPCIRRADKILGLSYFAIMMLLFAGLGLFLKLPSYLLPALLLFYILLITCLSEVNAPAVGHFNRPYKGLCLILFAAWISWSGIRTKKIISSNREKNKLFVCSWKELNNHPDKLFIVTNDGFPMDYFSVWDRPAVFPILNLLYKDEFLNNTYALVYKRFSITSPKDFTTRQNVLFVGENELEIGKYYHSVWGLTLHAVEIDKSFHCVDARKLQF